MSMVNIDTPAWFNDLEGAEPAETERPALPAIEIANEADANRALERRAEFDAELAKLDLLKRSIVANIEAKKKAVQRDIDWWDFRFAAPLKAFAKTLLKGKSKTAQFVYGKVSWRETKGSNRITDMAEAVAWAKSTGRGLVEIEESVAVTDVLKAKAQIEAENPKCKVHLAFVDSSAPCDKATISTGLEPK